MQFEVSSFTQFGDAPFFVFCDHASSAIPDDLNCLGLPDDLLDTHIAWDIGAGALAISLAEQLSGRVYCSAFSRLIIDPNRDPAATDLIPVASDQIPIPGNQMLSEEQRQERIERFHTPYHEQLQARLESMLARGPQNPLVISIHSFTNRLMGAVEERPWPVGFLWREDEPSARSMIAFLQGETGWKIGDNEPYDARVFNYTVDRHIGPRKLRHITVEIRQDMLAETQDIARMAELVARGVRTI